MDVLKQPHDKYFKATFGKVDFSADFLSNYLPKDLLSMIDMSTLEPKKDTYLDKELKEQFSDLLFQVEINNKEGYIYLLFEHKSYRDKLVIFQVLRYMLEIWESKIESDKKKRQESDEVAIEGNVEISIILPVVIYHDKGKWTVKRTLGELIPNYGKLSDDIKRYIPNFEYLLFDLSEWNKDAVKLQSENMISLKALSRTRHATKKEAIEILVEAIQLINQVEEKDSITYYVSECIRYMLSIRDDISEKEMKKIAERISKEGGELVMSVAERLRQEGLKEGLEQGIEKGAKKEKIRLAKKVIIKGYDLNEIIDLTGLTEKEIQKVKEEMLES